MRQGNLFCISGLRLPGIPNRQDPCTRTFEFRILRLNTSMLLIGDKQIDAHLVGRLEPIGHKPAQSLHLINHQQVIIVGRIERHSQLFRSEIGITGGIVPGDEQVITAQRSITFRGKIERNSIRQDKGVIVVRLFLFINCQETFIPPAVHQTRLAEQFEPTAIDRMGIIDHVPLLVLIDRRELRLHRLEKVLEQLDRSALFTQLISRYKIMPIHHHTVDHLHILHLFHQPEGIVRQIQLGLHILHRLLLFGAQIDIILIHLDRLLKPIGLVAQITHVAIGINHPSLDSHRQMFFSRFQITRFITAHTVP